MIDSQQNVCDGKVPNQNCINTDGSYICTCDEGFEMNPLMDCIDIDECLSNSTNECHTYASCNNTIGSYLCFCDDGWVGTGKACFNETWPCEFECPDCGDHAFCAVNNETLRVNCECEEGYEG